MLYVSINGLLTFLYYSANVDSVFKEGGEWLMGRCIIEWEDWGGGGGDLALCGRKPGEESSTINSQVNGAN